MELETKLGPSSKEPSEDLQSHEIIRVQVKREKPEMIDDTRQTTLFLITIRSYSSQGPLTIHLRKGCVNNESLKHNN